MQRIGSISALPVQSRVRSPWQQDQATVDDARAPEDTIAPHAASVEPPDTPRSGWRTAALAGLGLLSLSSCVSLPPATAALTLQQTQAVVSLPAPPQAPSPQQLAGSSQGDPSANVLMARQALDSVKLPALNPYAFTVASVAFANHEPKAARETIRVSIPSEYGKPVRADLNLTNGPGAPMLVIVPGAFSSRRTSTVNEIEQMALHHGMNFVAFDNPLNASMVDHKPVTLPGNPQVESRGLYDALRGLRDRYPGFFTHVSVTGYSYGGLLSAGMVDAQGKWLAEHPADRPIINGSVAAVSPPMGLRQSMRALDSLHQVVDTARAGSSLVAGLRYLNRTNRIDFHDIDPMTFQATRDGSSERRLVDDWGFRSGFESLLTEIDLHASDPRLPLDRSDASGTMAERMQAQQTLLNATRYDDYLRDQVARDPWYAAHGTTPEQVLDSSRYSDFLASARAQGVPVMTLVSSDDFILEASDVQAFRDLEAHPAPTEVTRVFTYGGHTGLYYAPEVRETLATFLAARPAPAAVPAPQSAPPH